MDNKELLNKAYLLRRAFMKDIENHIFLKKPDTQKIYEIYTKYIKELSIEENDYLELGKISSIKLKARKPKKFCFFFFWIYNMVSNIHNAFISRFYNDVDLQLFFSGFTLNSNISITDAISIFEDKSPYDIEYVELLSPYCKNELEIITSNKMIDIFLLFSLTSYVNKKDIIIWMDYLDIFKFHEKTNYIYSFYLKIFKLLTK